MHEPGRGGEPTSSPGARAVLAWLPILGCVAAGLVGLAGALLGMDRSDVRFPGGGIYLVGAALAFGILANALLRK